MKKIGVFLNLVFLLACSTSQQPSAYELSMKEHRKETHDYFLNPETSPLTEADRANFVGLNYFPVDSSFRFRLQPTWLNDTTIINLPTSTGEDRLLKPAARFVIPFSQRTDTLTAYFGSKQIGNRLIWDESLLFIPFTDETSAIETYGAGRYLEIEVEKGQNVVELDFNKAFNPYCAYSDRFSCPLPPAQNHLMLNVTAGERNWK